MAFITTSKSKQHYQHLNLLVLSISYFLLIAFANATTTTTTIPIAIIQRITKQQILATIPPATKEPTVPFLSSPSGKYTTYFLRRETAPNAGGFGNDFCYIQIQDTSTSTSVWESECQPVSSENACSLVFTDAGLSIFDGSNSAWDTGASSDNGFPETLTLVDLGDMRVIDQDGELVWKASDDARNNQNCGLPGSPGLSPESPPFVQPFGSVTQPPFGLDQSQPIDVSSQVVPPLPESNAGVVATSPAVGAVETEPVTPTLSGNNGVIAPAPVIDDDGNVDTEPVTPTIDSNGGIVAPEPTVAEAQPVSPLQHQFGLQQQHAGNGLSGGIGAQPLVDNSPYDSGSSRIEDLVAMGFGFVSLFVVSVVVF